MSINLPVSGAATEGHLKVALVHVAEISWLQHAIELLSQSKLETGDTIPLPGCHASKP